MIDLLELSINHIRRHTEVFAIGNMVTVLLEYIDFLNYIYTVALGNMVTVLLEYIDFLNYIYTVALGNMVTVLLEYIDSYNSQTEVFCMVTVLLEFSLIYTIFLSFWHIMLGAFNYLLCLKLWYVLMNCFVVCDILVTACLLPHSSFTLIVCTADQ